MLRFTKHGKRHAYDPVFVFEIQQDPQYYKLFFSYVHLVEKNDLYIGKKRKNGDITYLCPLHKERTPSFRVNAKNNCFKCFGCGKGGDIFKLFELYFKMTYFEAIRKVLSFKKVPAGTRARLKYVDPNQIALNLQEPHDPNDDWLPF